jgi:hypothetical protein
MVRFSLRYICALVALMACAACSDQSTNTNDNIPTPTAAQLALHFDSLAGQLQQLNPGDVRLGWYQEIDRIIARGALPTTVTANVIQERTVLESVAEVDAFPTPLNAQVTIDSTYILAAWTPLYHPTGFVDVHVNFLPAGHGQPDTTAAVVTAYLDTVGTIGTDDSADVHIGVANGHGSACPVTALRFLTVPQNPCTSITTSWVVSGGTGLLLIPSPGPQIPSIHLTPTL